MIARIDSSSAMACGYRRTLRAIKENSSPGAGRVSDVGLDRAPLAALAGRRLSHPSIFQQDVPVILIARMSGSLERYRETAG
jgi:hypothetical protein